MDYLGVAFGCVQNPVMCIASFTVGAGIFCGPFYCVAYIGLLRVVSAHLFFCLFVFLV